MFKRRGELILRCNQFIKTVSNIHQNGSTRNIINLHTTKVFLTNNQRTFSKTINYRESQANTEDELSQKRNPTESFTNPYVQSLRKFFMTVHPDFFAQFPKIQQQNQKSFQDLNALLGWIERYSQIPKKRQELKEGETIALEEPPSTQITFTFYCKPADQNSNELKEEDLTKIESTFSLPKKNFTIDGSQKSVLVASQRIDDAILALFEKSGVVAPNSVDRTAGTQPWKAFEKELSKGRLNSKSLRDELRTALAQNIQGAKNLDRYKQGFADEEPPSIDELLQKQMLYFNQNMPPQETLTAVNTLRENIHLMQYNKWQNTPIMIDSRAKGFAIHKPVDGFIRVPWDFTVDEFNKFLDASVPLLEKMREKKRSKVQELEDLRQKNHKSVQIQRCYVENYSRRVKT
jgi:hypothetical protein